MINKYLKFCVFQLLIVFLCVLVELFVYNFNPFFNSEKIDLTAKKNIQNNEISIDVNMYINKLSIDYNVKKDVNVKVISSIKNLYGKYEKNKISDTFSSDRHRMVMNFNSKVKRVIIKGKNLNKLSIGKVICDNSFHFNGYRFFFFLSLFELILITVYFFRANLINSKIYLLFFLISTVIGINFIILQPNTIYISWDDQIHYSNSFNLIGKDIKWRGSDYSILYQKPFIVESIDSIEENNARTSYLNSQNKVSHVERGNVAYNKVGYIFLGIGLLLGRIFGLSFGFYFKFAKLLNIIAYSAGFAFAIKKARIGKKLLFVIGLMPTAIFLACQYSYDPYVTLGLTLGIVYLVNAFVCEHEKVDFKWMFVFLLSMLVANFIKPVYVLFLLLFLFIPNNRFSSNKKAFKLKICIFILSLLILSTFVLPTVTGTMVGDSRGGNTSVSGQLSLILHHPLGYLKVLNNSMIGSFFDKLVGINTLGSFAYLGVISSNCYFLYLILLIFIAVSEQNIYKLPVKSKSKFILTILLVILLIWTALYLSFTPVGHMNINGVQGRYFIPLLYPLLLCFNFKVRKYNSLYDLFILLLPLIILFLSMYNNLLVPYNF